MITLIKICIITGTRAEFGLLWPLIKLLQNDSEFQLQVIATGMHLSPEFGSTYKNIEEAGIVINEKVEMLLSADTDTAIVKSAGLGMIGYADALNRLQPHFILLLGDRFETFAAATSAYLMKIPVIHLHGGEVTAGATDEGLRHSITKMSALHFTSTEEYRKRVLQLGEPDENVYNVGAIGLDNIKDLELLSRAQLEESLGIPLNDPILLITYHPVTLEHQTSKQQIQSLLDALEDFGKGKIIFTMPNADADGRVIIKLIQQYVNRNSNRAAAFTSLGQLRYLSLMKEAFVVVGNSSSGIIEAPSFGIPTINIGDRQKGRIASISVLHCAPDKDSITKALNKSFDHTFREICRRVQNPYETGGTSKKIMSILKSKLTAIKIKKEFVE